MPKTPFHKLHKAVPKKLAGGHETDLFQTPAYAMPMLDQYLNPDWMIWEPACGKCNIVNYFNKDRRRCWGTDFLDGAEYDFFRIHLHPTVRWDCIVTNPPWSLKIEWAYRCIELGKPFSLLVPITFLEGSGTRMVHEYDMELIMPYQRIAFETPHEGWWGHYGDGPDGKPCKYIDPDEFKVCPKCLSVGYTAGYTDKIRQIVSSPQKKSMWVTWRLNIGQQVVYYDMAADRAKFKET